MTRWPRTSRQVQPAHRLGVLSCPSSSWANSRAITLRLAVVRRCTWSGMRRRSQTANPRSRPALSASVETSPGRYHGFPRVPVTARIRRSPSWTER